MLATFDDATALTSVINCNLAWQSCEGLTTFDASGLKSVTTCNEAWKDCINLDTFTGVPPGLILSISYVDAWDGTPISGSPPLPL